MTEAWPFVGREAEVEQIRSLLCRGRPRGVVLSGSAGMGKTRLALECMGIADRLGRATVHVTALKAASAIPFGPFVPLLSESQLGEARGADDRASLLRRLSTSLLDEAGPRGLCLLVDDAHLLDDASATLVYQLAATGRAFVLATVRSLEPTPDPVLALWKDGFAERIELHGLGGEVIAKLLSRALGGPIDPATVGRLAQRCKGNVMFLRELVMGARRDGSLCADGGLWHQVAPFVPSERLVDLVEARLAGLTPAERTMLELVAFGEPLGRAELTELGDPIVAEALERNGLLVSTVNGRRLEIRLAHPLYGDVVRGRVPALRVAELARSLAQVVEATGARRHEDTLRVATWRLDGGGARSDLMLVAARTARWRYAFPLAERLALAAVETGAGFEAKLLAVQLASLQGRGIEVDNDLAALAAGAASDYERAQVALARLDHIAFHLARANEGLQIAEETEKAITDPVWRDEVRARRAGVLLLVCSGGPRTAAEAVEPLVHRAAGSTKVWACAVAAYGLGRLGRLREALQATVDGLRAHEEITTPLSWYPWLHLHHRAAALGHLGRFADSDQLALAQYEQGIADGSVEAQAYFAWQLASGVEEKGHVRTSVLRAREAAVLFKQLGQPLFVRYSLVRLALGSALAGDGAETNATLTAIEDMGLTPDLYVCSGDLLHARAWIAAAQGDLSAARANFEQAVDLGESTGDLIGQAVALHGLVRLGEPGRAVDRLEVLADRIEGRLTATRAAHARALVHQDATHLATVSAAFEEMGATLLAAEVTADEGRAWRIRGDRRKAAGAERRAAALAIRCEGAATPALRSVSDRDVLTPAERKAALLAAAGRSNRAIAEELSLSVRTVESQLHSVYEKLGLAGRSELPGALQA